ncbi:TonB-dependent receptor [Microbulbifer halophilus]|uniref:TonB-dependent receptor n=1 Tax=Microbulbifer halophilus TaxID=453963 RepID=A0ABW5EAM5_9GAMM|nr:TonB-dependent receptor [Microbulbifer halophilus]MCW8125727.1 TonB-dependent receptor [Microbulbifer halophilus]
MPTTFNKKLLSLAVYGAVSGLLPAAAGAQESEGAAIEEIVVYGDIRDNLISAQSMKRDADTVVDAITASDIGALPDKSVTEALQRLPGVSIERFASSEDPNHYADEGTGVLVRGLDRVRSEINGRTSFSANPQGGLNFEDIPPELLGAVEVVKNQTADLVAGGIGGTVNLVTRKPFDQEEALITGSVKGSYSDFRGETTPVYSFLFSDRWQTGAGEFGALLSFSESEYKTRGDGIGVANFYSRGPGADTEGGPLLGYEDSVVFFPGQTSIRTANNDRERQGLAGSLQWQNNDGTVVATAEYINSDAALTWRERVIGQQGQGFVLGEQTDLNLAPDTEATFDENGMFTSGTIRNNVLPYLLSSRFNSTENEVEDMSFNVVLTPTDRLSIELDAQRIEASQRVKNYGINAGAANTVTDTYVDLTGSRPQIEYLNPNLGNPDPASAEAGTPDLYLRTLLDQDVDNDAESTAFSLDVDFEVDAGWVRSVSGGAYYSDKDLTIRDTEYSNWGVAGISWGGAGSMSASAPSMAPDEWERVDLGDFYDSGNRLQGQDSFLFPKMSSAEDFVEFTRRACESGISNVAHGGNAASSPAQTSADCYLANPDLGNRIAPGSPFAPQHISSTNEERTEAYFRLDFGNDELAVPLRGNLGLRYVSYQLESSGYTSMPAAPSANAAPYYPQDILAFADGTASELQTVEGTDYSTVLPSFNLAAGLHEDVVLRFAASNGLYFPTLDQTRYSRIVSVLADHIGADGNPAVDNPNAWNYNPTTAVENIQLYGAARNPDLEPEEVLNLDLTAEWYFAELGSLTGGIFYKDIDNLFRERSFVESVTSESGETKDVNFSGPVNQGSGSLRGLELSYTQFYDFLPGAWSGLGLQLNYTYIDQQDLNDQRSDEEVGSVRFTADGTPIIDNRNTFRAFSDLPLPGYSDENYNVTGMYEYEDLSLRLAYNWRSRYLVTRRDSNEFAPVYAKAAGFLDGSVFYNINENMELGLEASNLLETETRTEVQLDQEGTTTDALNFTTDRRYALVFRAKF